MRISDWSSDVCSSDLSQALALGEPQPPDAAERALRGHLVHADRARGPAIGKAEAVEFVEHPRHRPGRKAGDREAAQLPVAELRREAPDQQFVGEQLVPDVRRLWHSDTLRSEARL